jgi:hypothetical protein
MLRVKKKTMFEGVAKMAHVGIKRYCKVPFLKKAAKQKGTYPSMLFTSSSLY